MNDLQTLWVNNQALIYSIIFKYFKDYGEKDDLFQEAYKAFKQAYENYDSSFQVKFTTYVYPYIVFALKHFVNNNKMIRPNREMMKLLLKIEKATIILTQQLMREPTTKELANTLGISCEKVQEALNSTISLKSLEEPVCEEGKQLFLYDTIPAQTNEIDLASQITLQQELEKLSPQDRYLIEARYYQDCTQSETASMLGMTQVQVSRREAKVLQLLRQRCAS